MFEQTPAQGILLQHKFHNSYHYFIPCDCGNPEDAMNFMIEIDDDTNDISMQIETVQRTDWYSTVVDWKPWRYESKLISEFIYYAEAFVNGFIRRLKLTKDIWVNGYIEQFHTTIMNKQTALNFSATIVSAIKTLEESQKDKLKGK